MPVQVIGVGGHTVSDAPNAARDIYPLHAALEKIFANRHDSECLWSDAGSGSR